MKKNTILASVVACMLGVCACMTALVGCGQDPNPPVDGGGGNEDPGKKKEYVLVSQEKRVETSNNTYLTPDHLPEDDKYVIEGRPEGTEYTYRAEHITDGRTDTEWANEATPERVYVTIDLGQAYQITKVELESRYFDVKEWNFSEGYTYQTVENFSIEVSNDPDFLEFEVVYYAEGVAKKADGTEWFPQRDTFTVDESNFFTGYTAETPYRFVRYIQHQSGRFISLSEMRVYTSVDAE